MRGRVFLFLFGVPFACVGLWAGWSVGSSLYDAWRMSGWPSTTAIVTTGGFSTRTGDDSVTYEAYATYDYRVATVEYRNDRVSLNGGADNIGDYQQSIGRQLSTAASERLPVAVYYNPEDPQDSILFPELRWGLLAFKGIFLLVFGGVGLGLMVLAFRARTPKDPEDPAYSSAPWLANDDWQSPTIRSGSRTAMFVSWGVAAFWNLVSMPLPFLLVDEVLKKGNYIALVGLLFPAVGVALVAWALRRTREWRRFGATPVTLDPFPGAIGGHVGGSIDLSLPFSADYQFRVTLTNLRRTTSGSGKNRSTSEKPLWQKDGRAAVETGPRGTRLLFRFDVPEGLSASDAVRSGNSSVSWKLNVSASLPGVDLDRDYEIPVYPTGELSGDLPEAALKDAFVREDRADEASVRQLLDIRHTPSGKQIHFPAGRHKLLNVSLFLFGAAFAAVGGFLLFEEGETFMGAIFGGIGSLVALGALYAVSNSLTVTASAGNLHSVRCILNLPVSTRTMRIAAVRSLKKNRSMSSQSGGTHTIYYSIRAYDRQGNKLIVAEGLKGDGDADVARRIIAAEFGITDSGNREDPESAEDILASDH